MATKQALKDKVNANITDNTSRANTPAKHREVEFDIIDQLITDAERAKLGAVDVIEDGNTEPTIFKTGDNNTISTDANGGRIAGKDNLIDKFVERGLLPKDGPDAIGVGVKIYDWSGRGSGSHTVIDGKLSAGDGNHMVVTANDSYGGGNRGAAGRRITPIASSGTEVDGDVGDKPFVIIDDWYGDVTSYFPNELTDNVTTRYGAGYQKDAKGNIYSPAHTPATYAGNDITAENDLKWAMHSFCYIKGVGETAGGFFRILKATYTAGVGTKIFYDNVGQAFSGSIESIYCSYSPVVLNGGNGQLVGGYKCSTWGYGAFACGVRANAWEDGSAAFGTDTYGLEKNTLVHGKEVVAKRPSQSASSAGAFLEFGDNQSCQMQLRRYAGGGAYQELTTDNAAPNATNQLFLEDNRTYSGFVIVVGREINEDKHFGYMIKFVAYRNEGAATVTVLSSDVETLGESVVGASAVVTADVVNGCLSVRADGGAGNDVRWHANIFWSEVKGNPIV